MARVSNFATGNGPHLRRLDGSHGDGVPVERRELDLERLAVLVDVNDGPDITDFQAFAGNWRRQDDSLMLSDHADVSLLAGVCRDQPRRLLATVNDPHRANQPRRLSTSVPRQDTIHNKFLAVAGLDVLSRIESQRLEKASLAAIVWMRRVQQILSDLAPIDDRQVRVSQLHAEPIVSWTPIALDSWSLETITEPDGAAAYSRAWLTHPDIIVTVYGDRRNCCLFMKRSYDASEWRTPPVRFGTGRGAALTPRGEVRCH